MPEALQDLSKLDGSAMRRVVKRIAWLANNLEYIQPERLSGELAALFKLRAGDYRILYQLLKTDDVILIHQIGHRREIYR